jgi:hypothetical protein
MKVDLPNAFVVSYCVLAILVAYLTLNVMSV